MNGPFLMKYTIDEIKTLCNSVVYSKSLKKKSCQPNVQLFTKFGSWIESNFQAKIQPQHTQLIDKIADKETNERQRELREEKKMRSGCTEKEKINKENPEHSRMPNVWDSHFNVVETHVGYIHSNYRIVFTKFFVLLTVFSPYTQRTRLVFCVAFVVVAAVHSIVCVSLFVLHTVLRNNTLDVVRRIQMA